jgi:tRNA-Thr(GGU) m(6)t(6)A37 methyltransferase TsaA
VTTGRKNEQERLREMLSVEVKPIGVVRVREDESAVLAVLPPYRAGLKGLVVGARVQVLYWMHELAHADRQRLQVHPGGDITKEVSGVFSLRSCVRPNPIGVTEAQVLTVGAGEVVVSGLDAKDGSPLIDIKAC